MGYEIDQILDQLLAFSEVKANPYKLILSQSQALYTFMNIETISKQKNLARLFYASLKSFLEIRYY